MFVCWIWHFQSSDVNVFLRWIKYWKVSYFSIYRILWLHIFSFVHSCCCFPVIINNLDKMYSNKNVKENRRDNQEWIIQRHVKHRTQDTERRQTKQKNTTQKKKKINWLIWGLESYSYGVQRHFKQYFSYIVAISIIGGGHQLAWGGNSSTCLKSLTLSGADPGFVVRWGVSRQGVWDRLSSPAGPRQSPGRGHRGANPPPPPPRKL